MTVDFSSTGALKAESRLARSFVERKNFFDINPLYSYVDRTKLSKPNSLFSLFSQIRHSDTRLGVIFRSRLGKE